MLSRRRDPKLTFDESIEAKIEAVIERIDQAGKWDEDAEDKLSTALTDATMRSAPTVADAWIKMGRSYLKKMDRFTRGFEKQLRKDYGPGLDRMQTFIAVTADLGNSYTKSDRASRREPYYFRALSGLHARACRVANEVHCLLEHGYPRAALARTRTLHELSVVATVLAEHETTHADLAERYVLHETILNSGDARVYQERASRLGYTPFTPEFIESLSDDFDDLVERFGKPYKRPFGWAADLLGNGDPKFDQLENLADLAHMRGHYKWATREVHADSKGLRLNTIERGGEYAYLTGVTNVGLADPAAIAVAALQSVTIALMLQPEDASPSANLNCASLSHMSRSIKELFMAGEERIAVREDSLQARLARKRRPVSNQRE